MGGAGTRGFWYRFSHLVMRGPVPLAALSAALLIALGLPFAGIKFNSVDQTDLPASSDARIVHDTLVRDYGAPTGATLTIVAEAPTSDGAEVQSLANSLSALNGVDRVTTPQPVGPDTWKFTLQTKLGTFDPAAQQLVRDARAQSAPFPVLVSGQAAAFVDLQESLASRLPLAIAIVAIATILILFFMTGSLVLPIKAVLMNLLTLSAAFGVLLLLFHDAPFKNLLHYTTHAA